MKTQSPAAPTWAPRRPAARPPAIAFVAPSGTGKTTLVESLVREFTRRGRRVGALKHDAHRFEIDTPGKDSARFTAAGAQVMVLASAERVAAVLRPEAPPAVDDLLDRWFAGVELVLVEGYRNSALPRLEVFRAGTGRPLTCRGDTVDPLLVAVASDIPLVLDVPVLDLGDAAAIADFIEEVLKLPRSSG